MKKYTTLLLAVLGLLAGLAAIISAVALSSCAVPKTLTSSTHTATDSTATSSVAINAGQHVTAEQTTHSSTWIDSVGRRITTTLTFAPLTTELIGLGVKSPPVASATHMIEGSDVRQGESSISEGRYQSDVYIAVVTDDSVMVNRDIDVEVSEAPAPDPYRWRWIFGSLVILAAGVWWAKRRFF